MSFEGVGAATHLALTLRDALERAVDEAGRAARLAESVVEQLEKVEDAEQKKAERETLDFALGSARRTRRGVERVKRCRVLAEDLAAMLRDFRRVWQGE